MIFVVGSQINLGRGHITGSIKLGNKVENINNVKL